MQEVKMEESGSRFIVKSYATVILAAGSSSRLGSPKQLLSYQGKTLLEYSIDSAKAAGAAQVIVVLGSGRKLIENRINHEGIVIVENTNWESGIASSINAGITALKDISPDIDAVILMVCDQPFADGEVLKKLISSQAQSGKAIVGCFYENTRGIPALFHCSIFPQLLSLEGDSGAKKLFDQYKDIACFVPFVDGGIDIDTSEDYKNLPK